MKIYRLTTIAAAALCIASCGQKAKVECTVSQAPQSEIIVKQLNVNQYDILDTVKTDKNGAFKYSVEVLEGQPEFIYLFYGDTKIASLLLQTGEKAVVEADTLGNYSVSGSAESEKLKEVESSFAQFAGTMTSMVNKIDDPSTSEAEKSLLRGKMGKEYISHYRECVKYILSNPYSLTDIPVLYENLNEYSPVFSQVTDAIHFRAVYDSLRSVYPDSRYVKALGKETQRREQQMELSIRLGNALESGFPDLNMPDINGKLVKLSDLRNKAILVHFWSLDDATHKMFNTEVLQPVYDEFHKKGFEIYSICIGEDKAAWASVVKNQNLPWINVCDGNGWNSTALETYNVQEMPTSFLIANGSLSTNITGTDGLRRDLNRILK